MKQKLIVSLRVISIKKASARAVYTVIAKCLYNRFAHPRKPLDFSYSVQRDLSHGSWEAVNIQTL